MKKLLISGLVLATGMMSSLTYAPKVEAASAANWVECASENSQCNFGNSANKVVSMRYGNPGHYRYMWVRNRYNGKLDCNNHAGDPDKGNNKKCQYSQYNFYDIPSSDSQWSNYCNEGSWCNAPGGDTVRWMRYGRSGKYFYTPVSPNQRFKCSHNDMFGDKDPYKGQGKQCSILKSSLDDTLGLGKEADFITCASEGSTCYLPSLRPTIVRYGAYDNNKRKYRYITGIVSNDKLKCNNSMFREDPIGKHKTCEYLPIEYKVNSTASAYGKWTHVTDNEHSGDRSLSFAIWTGVSETDTDTTSAEWSRSITVGIEAGGLETGGVKISTSATQSFAESSSFSTALGISQQERVSVSCSSDAGFLQMWRFETDISFDNCLSDGVCDFKVLPLSTVCTDANVEPQCIPGRCKPGTNCQQCY
jgi:hypothetical protein